jgi:hypothetical protein
MTKRYKPLIDYKSLDSDYKSVGCESELDKIEAYVNNTLDLACEQLNICGVTTEDIDRERLSSDLSAKLVRFALYCNAHPSRSPKMVMATVKKIGRDPQAFLDDSESYDPEAETMVLGETARLSFESAALVQQYVLGVGPAPDISQIAEAVPFVLAELGREMQEMKGGRPLLAFQSELACDLGIIFRAQGGKLRRNPKQIKTMPFRSFIELMIEVVQPFAWKAGFALTATTMIEKAQEALEPAR